MVVPGVDQESQLHRIPSHILNQFRMMETPMPETQSGLPIELLRPLLGRGEREVITCAYIHFQRGNRTFLFILDDGVARDLVKRILPGLTEHLKGTVGFIGFCAGRKILEKDEAIHLITVIGMSRFRVDRSTIAMVIADIENLVV